MKKILLVLFVVGTAILVVYLVTRDVNDDEIMPAGSIYFSPLQPAESANNQLPKNDITTILNDTISPTLQTVLNSIYRDNYYVFSCGAQTNDGQSIILTALYDGSIARDGYDKAYYAIKDWEKNVMVDFGHILFSLSPSETAPIDFAWFVPYKSTNPHIWARDFHKAVIYIGDTKYEVHYGWTLNYVIFAPSQLCLESTMHALYHAH